MNISFRKLSLGIIYTTLLFLVYFFSFLNPPFRIALLSIGCMLCILNMITSASSKVQPSWIKGLWLMTWIVVLIGMSRCQVYDIHYMLFYTIMFFLIVNVKQDDFNQLQYCIKFVYYIGIFFALFTVLPLFSPKLYSMFVPFMRVNGNYDVLIFLSQGIYSGLTNQTGINSVYLAMGIGAAFVESITGEKNKKMIYLVVIIFEVVCILLTSKRGACIFSLLSLVLVYYYHGNKGKRITRVVKITFALFALIVIAYYFIPSVNLIFTRILDGSAVDYSNGRNVIYESALSFFKENRTFGIGWMNFRYMHYRYVDVHNVYLQLLCETGIVGSVFFYSAFAVSFISTIKHIELFKQYDTPMYRLLLFSLFAETFVLLQMLTENGLYDYYVFFFFFLSVIIQVCSKRYYFDYVNG